MRSMRRHGITHALFMICAGLTKLCFNSEVIDKASYGR